MSLLSEDELELDETNTLNKVAGTVETKLTKFKDSELSPDEITAFENQLKGRGDTYNHKFPSEIFNEDFSTDRGNYAPWHFIEH